MPCAGLLGVRDALFAALKLDIFMCHADRVRLTNIDPDCPLAIVPTIAGKRIRAITGQVLTAATVDAVNTVAAPDAVAQ
jgi:alpha-L-arabinofuranosidase